MSEVDDWRGWAHSEVPDATADYAARLAKLGGEQNWGEALAAKGGL